jgi:hypothetical protein
MSAVDALTSVHVFLLVAWLGIDVGVFSSSFVIRKRGLSADARVEIRRIMRGLDLAPRLSLVLMIAVGPAMARSYGLGATGGSATWLWVLTAVVVVWAAGIVWSYGRLDPLGRPKRPDDGAWARRFAAGDLALRVLAATFFVATGVHSLLGDGLWAAPRIAWKSALFGAAIAAGLWIRVAARPFSPALRSVVEQGESESSLQEMDRAMHRTYPAVLTIWTLVAIIAMIGITGR